MLDTGKIIFWGTPEFALPSLQALHEMDLISAVVTQPDKPAGRGKKLLASPVKQYCLDNNIDILEPVKLDQAFIDGLKKYLPTTFVVVAYGKIIPQAVLDLSDLSAINIHPSKLPELRGPSPIQTALLRGFESTAVSLMQLDEKMDHGPILGQLEVKIEPNEDYIGLAERLSELGAKILADKVNDYLSGQLTPLPQDDKQATFCKMIAKQDGQVDWSESAQEIHNQVRAFRQWPTAFTELGKIDLKIIQTQVVDKKLSIKEVLIEKDQMFVGTSKQTIEILQVQPAGKKILKTADFVRGYGKNFK
jgi:methionyl-tRNA formyltransferase